MLASPLIIRPAKPRDEGVDMASISVPIMTAVPPVANNTGVPDTAISGPPGVRVWFPMMKSD
jgi:hypothetical protein